jgi:hypothetical protein
MESIHNYESIIFEQKKKKKKNTSYSHAKQLQKKLLFLLIF